MFFFLESYESGKKYTDEQSGLESESDIKQQQAEKAYKRQHPAAGFEMSDYRDMTKVCKFSINFKTKLFFASRQTWMDIIMMYFYLLQKLKKESAKVSDAIQYSSFSQDSNKSEKVTELVKYSFSKQTTLKMHHLFIFISRLMSNYHPRTIVCLKNKSTKILINSLKWAGQWRLNKRL